MTGTSGAAEPERRTLPLAEGAINALVWPGEGPSLHFAHANGFNAETYRTLLSPLAGAARLFATDLRGHGATTLPADPGRMNSWTRYRDDLIGVLEALGAGPYVLAGHSMGATTSLLAAAKRPDLVRALVLFEPVMVPAGVFWGAKFWKAAGLWDKRMGKQFDTRKRRAVFPSREAAVEAYRGRGAFRTWPDWAIADYVRGGLKAQADGTFRLACDPEWETANFRTLPPPLNGPVKRLKAPLTILHGTIASTARPSVLAMIRARKPEARIESVEGATHFLPMERPELAREALTRALGR